MTQGTHEDIARYGIDLKEGLRLNFWSDDENENGEIDPLLFSGVAHYSESESAWVAELDDKGFWYLSDVRK